MADEARTGGSSRSEKRPARASGGQLAKSANGSVPSSGNVLLDGYTASRAVKQAKRAHASARTKLRKLNDGIADSEKQLRHRTEVERHYEAIVRKQTNELNDAQAAAAAAQAEVDRLTREHAELDAQLKELRASNELERRPYKNLMESSRSRSDDAGKNLASIRRSVKAAESQVSEATASREARIASANRAVDGSAARITQLTAEIAELQDDPNTSPDALESLQRTMREEQAHFQQAKTDVVSVTEESQQLVADAQTHLFGLRQSLEEAERNSEAAKNEARKHKEAYDRMLEGHQAAEAALEKQIVDNEVDAHNAAKDLERARERGRAAQAILDDANAIHATPEQTRELAREVSAAHEQISAQQAKVEALARQESELRGSTRVKRFVLYAVLVLVALLIIFIILLVTGVIRFG